MLKKKRIAGIMILSVVLSANISTVHAVSVNSLNSSINNVKSISNDSNNNDILVDSSIKEFDNVNKVGKYLDFNFKVPDYTMDEAKVSLIRVEKYDDGIRNLQIEYNNKSNHDDIDKENTEINNWYSIYEFKGDPEQALKDIKYSGDSSVHNIQISKENKKLGELNGMYITLTADIESFDFNNPDKKSINKEYSKFYVFKEDGIFYGFDAMDFDGEDKLSTEINKIESSLKNPLELSNVSYEIHRDNELSNFVDVYDSDDLKRATEMIGFTPKFMRSIYNDDIKIIDCTAHAGTNGKSKQFQCDYSWKNDNIIVFIQEKDNDNYDYEGIVNGKYSDRPDYEKLNWNNVDIYKYYDEGDRKYIYQWKDGDMYYFFETYFNGDKENVDDIVKVLVDAK